MTSSADTDVRPRRSTKTCKKCQGPVRGHVGPHADLCRNPSPQFLLGDALELAIIPSMNCSNIYKVCTRELNFLFCDIIIRFLGRNP